ncbi:T9SS type A sorting domain-containing protein [Panacibacter sp. DH6]|uniref:T9SS type A sorting domain-containing protein n=1 Tax=Panacibacter microcysteis TaxID=2793269 RepID=A0A931GZ83_9BACT|nr:T9SS type A sorting domain-containing protein [Panacibacter microcysteis]MBG9378079.1 T9SS type A sorting domain-containing protein [Panacibacter microcysteis]
MKKILFLLLLLGISLPAFVQSTFEKGFGGPNASEYQTDFKRISSNKFLLVGYTQNFGAGSNDIYIVCTDASGNMRWSNTYGTAASEKNAQCAVADDGSFLLVAETYETTSATANSILLIKCAPNGDVQWTRNINSHTYASLSVKSATAAPGGNFYFTADPGIGIIPKGLFKLFRVNASGVVTLQKTVNTLAQDVFASAAVAVREDGAVAVAGKFSVTLFENAGSAGLMVFDSTGVIQSFQSVYCANCDPTYESTYPMKVYGKNKQWQIAGIIYYAGKHFWLRLDKNSTVVSASTVKQSDFAVQYAVNHQLLTLPDGAYYNLAFNRDGSMFKANRYYGGDTYNYDMMLYKYDSLGRICTGYRVPKFDSIVTPKNFTVTNIPYTTVEDGITTGAYDIATNKINAVTVFCEGSANTKAISQTASNDISLHKPAATVAPNPAVSTITVSVNKTFAGKAVLYITAADGKIVQTINTTLMKGLNNIPVDVASLNKGLYFIRISDGEQHAVLRFIKQ